MSTSQADRSDEILTGESIRGISLLEGEQVLKNVLPSWTNWWLLLIPTALIGLLGLLILLGGDFGAGLVFLIVAGVLFNYVRYSRKRSRYIVTNQRVKKSVGILRRSTGETRIADIRGLTTEQSIIERLVGKGSVLIDSGAAAGRLGIKGVADHEELASTIREQQRRIEAHQE